MASFFIYFISLYGKSARLNSHSFFSTSIYETANTTRSLSFSSIITISGQRYTDIKQIPKSIDPFTILTLLARDLIINLQTVTNRKRQIISYIFKRGLQPLYTAESNVPTWTQVNITMMLLDNKRKFRVKRIRSRILRPSPARSTLSWNPVN